MEERGFKSFHPRTICLVDLHHENDALTAEIFIEIGAWKFSLCVVCAQVSRKDRNIEWWQHTLAESEQQHRSTMSKHLSSMDGLLDLHFVRMKVRTLNQVIISSLVRVGVICKVKQVKPWVPGVYED